jgi:hypothetical protein
MFTLTLHILIELRIEETLDKWRLIMAKSIDLSKWLVIPFKGGYTIHPISTPTSTKAKFKGSNNDSGNDE